MKEIVQNVNYFTISFLNVDNSINIQHKLFKFGESILDIIIEGTMSQICY